MLPLKKKDRTHVARTEPNVSVEALNGFTALVDRLGGNAAALLAKFHIDPVVMDDAKGVLPYRTLVNLLEQSAAELDCPDFGMKLAAIQGPFKIIGPLGVAMRNSATLGDALRYGSRNGRVFSKAASVVLEKLAGQTYLLRFKVVLEHAPTTIQAIEHHLSLLHHAIPVMSGDRARAHEVWFVHEPNAKLAAYRACFARSPRFGQSMNGLLLHESDLEVRLANPDRQLYALATSFIDHSFPPEHTPLSERLRMLITRLLREGDCTHERVSAELSMHPRTLQRRLKEEGATFESIKDSVRRDAALYYLSQSHMPLVQIAAALGYWEVSTLSRSCYRWFSASPRRLRKALLSGERITADE
jgi:AraC-like DNA-binding protein